MSFRSETRMRTSTSAGKRLTCRPNCVGLSLPSLPKCVATEMLIDGGRHACDDSTQFLPVHALDGHP